MEKEFTIGRRPIVPVPWIHKEEWEDIYKKFYSNNVEDLKCSLRRVSAWASRSHPFLSLGIEVTAAIIRAKLKDMTETNDPWSNHNAQVLYSMAVIRFVNLVSELGQLNRFATPIRDAAAQMGIPEWIVDLRHRATHGQIPSLNMLRSFVVFALEWLKLNYWEKEKAAMRDWRIESGVPSSVGDEQIKSRITLFQQNRYEILYGSYSKGDRESRKAVQKDILHNIELSVKKHRIAFIKRLVEPGFLIPRENQLEAILKPEEKGFLRDESTYLPHSLEVFWLPILKLFSNGKSLQVLLESLLSVQDPLAQRLAIAWVERFLELTTTSGGRGASSVIVNSLLTQNFYKEFTLDWFPLLKVGLKAPNKYTPRVLPRITHQVQHLHNTRLPHTLMALTAIYLGATLEEKQKIGGKSQKIYTAKDVAAVVNVAPKVQKNGNNPWKMCEDHVEWSKYPMGTTPTCDFIKSYSIDLQIETTDVEYISSSNAFYSQSSCEDLEGSENESFEVDHFDYMEQEEIHLEKTFSLTYSSTCSAAF